MKTVTHGVQVEDLGGLYYDLVKKDFEVENVASDIRGTYVHLRDGEGKDPIPVVKEWIGRPLPSPTRKVLEERLAIEAALREDRERRATQERARLEAERARLEAEAKAKREADAKAAAEAAEAAKPKPPSLISRVFRKLW